MVLDVIACIITATVLLVGLVLVISITYFSKSIVPQANRRFQDYYSLAVWRFGRLFQRPYVRSSKSQRHLLPSAPVLTLNASKCRNKRVLDEHSMAMDFTNETNLCYSASALSNNVVATASHLEYCFDEAPLILQQHLQQLQLQQDIRARANSEEQWRQLQLAYLPPISENRSVESLSITNSPQNYYDDSLSVRYLHADRLNVNKSGESRNRLRRSIILFTGPEDRERWLLPDDDEDDFRDRSSGSPNDDSRDSISDGYSDEFSSSDDKRLNGRQFQPIEERDENSDNTGNQHSRAQQWMQLLRQPHFAWITKPSTTETKQDIHQYQRDFNNTNPHGSSHFGQPAHEELLPPFPGSLQPRQLQSISARNVIDEDDIEQRSMGNQISIAATILI